MKTKRKTTTKAAKSAAKAKTPVPVHVLADANSMEKTLRAVTRDYLSTLDRRNLPPLEDIGCEVLDRVKDAFGIYNAGADKEEKWAIPRVLVPVQVADIAMACFHVVNVSLGGEFSDKEYDLPAFYQESGKDKGIYSIAEVDFKRIFGEISYTMREKDMNEAMARIRVKAPRVELCPDIDIVPVNNGLFDYRSKKLLPFSPDKVFISKSPVDYIPNAANPVIHNPADGTDWDMEGWMDGLSDDKKVVNLLWQLAGAVVRPGVKWNKVAMLYSEVGNNGKGTLCRLLENLCGKKNCASIQMSNFSKDFILETLIRANAIIVDENDVGGYIDKASVLKSVITGDTIQINRKYKKPISYQFRGIMVQCVNELPKSRDKTSSMYRRQLIIPFDKCYTGMERKYIKDDYLGRKEVLEYALCRVLHMDYYELDEPDACKALMAEYKEYNDPVLAFWNEFRSQFAWDLLPFQFLYDLYRAWHDRYNPGGTLNSKDRFCRDLRKIIDGEPGWEATEKNGSPAARGNRMSVPEPLILEYDLRNWKNPKAGVGYVDSDRACVPSYNTQTYRGLYRVTGGTGGGN